MAEQNHKPNHADPATLSGTLTILIPGTNWESSGGWGTDNPLFACGALLADATAANRRASAQGQTIILRWGGGNSDRLRLAAAEMLRVTIASRQFVPGDKLNIFAHSHGGNVALAASRLGLAHRIDNLITLNKPMLTGPAYAVGHDVGKFFNISARRDWLQWAGSNAKLWGKWAYDPDAVNLMVDTCDSDLKPHGALIWDDKVREGWWRWLIEQGAMQ